MIYSGQILGPSFVSCLTLDLSHTFLCLSFLLWKVRIMRVPMFLMELKDSVLIKYIYQLYVATSKLPIRALHQFLLLNAVFGIWRRAYLGEVGIMTIRIVRGTWVKPGNPRRRQEWGFAWGWVQFSRLSFHCLCCTCSQSILGIPQRLRSLPFITLILMKLSSWEEMQVFQPLK